MKREGSIRLYDWNQSIGCLLVAILSFGVALAGIFDPDFFGPSEGWKYFVVIFVGPVVGSWSLWRTVFWIDLGTMISFQRIFGRRVHHWNELTHLHLDTEVTRYALGLVKITNHYLEFTALVNETPLSHRLRVTPKSLPVVMHHILSNRPDLINKATTST